MNQSYKERGILQKNISFSKNTPFKIGVLSEKTYNFAPSTDKKIDHLCQKCVFLPYKSFPTGNLWK